jgi:hypothetical protein
MATPYYAYLVLKVPGTRGIISIRGDVKQAFDYDRDSYGTADRLTASVELQELKQALAESPRPPNPVMPKAKTSKMSIQQEDTLSKTILLSTEDPSKVLTYEIIWIPNQNSRSSNSSRRIETSLHGSLLICLEFLVN